MIEVSIKQFEEIMFFDNEKEVNLRTKKTRTTKEIKFIEDLIHTLGEQRKRQGNRGVFYYLGQPYTKFDIQSLEFYLYKLTNLRNTL